MADWKSQLSALRATVPVDDTPPAAAPETAAAAPRQHLRVELDMRRGKPATLVTGFEGSDDELKELAKTLKVRCGVGGSARGGEILVQGDLRVKVAALLEDLGHRVRRIGFK